VVCGGLRFSDLPLATCALILELVFVVVTAVAVIYCFPSVCRFVCLSASPVGRAVVIPIHRQKGESSESPEQFLIAARLITGGAL